MFYSNVNDGDFVQLSTELETKTTITHQLALNVLADRIYYKILATDFRENDSPYSEVVPLTRPDVIAPSKPLLTKVEPKIAGIQLEWIYSTSDDVVKHELQRKRANDKNWEIIGAYPIGSTDTTLIDSSTQGIQSFVYRMVATDHSNLSAASPSVEVKPIKMNLDTITAFAVASAVDGTQKQAKLLWKYPNLPEVREFQVYRGIESGAPHLYKTYKIIPDEVTLDPIAQRAIYVYKDKEIDPNKKYTYQVVAKYQDGSTSALSYKLVFQY